MIIILKIILLIIVVATVMLLISIISRQNLQQIKKNIHNKTLSNPWKKYLLRNSFILIFYYFLKAFFLIKKNKY